MKKTIEEARAELKPTPSKEEQQRVADQVPKLRRFNVLAPPVTWDDLASRVPVFGEVGILLLSGGMDSAACLHLLAGAYAPPSRSALLVDYGQSHRDRELGAAQAAADALGVRWDRIAVADALTAIRPFEILANAPHSAEGVHPATVPLRNLFLQSLAAMHACSRWPAATRIDVWMGACLDDAGFIDCHPDAVAQNTLSLTVNSGKSIRVVAPLLHISKAGLVRAASTDERVLASLRASWSCYRGGARACGECTPCVLRANAFEMHGLEPYPFESFDCTTWERDSTYANKHPFPWSRVSKETRMRAYIEAYEMVEHKPSKQLTLRLGA